MGISREGEGNGFEVISLVRFYSLTQNKFATIQQIEGTEDVGGGTPVPVILVHIDPPRGHFKVTVKFRNLEEGKEFFVALTEQLESDKAKGRAGTQHPSRPDDKKVQWTGKLFSIYMFFGYHCPLLPALGKGR